MSEIKSRVQAQFGATAAGYVDSPVHSGGPDLARMVELAALRGDERVLDIATGGGHTALAFSRQAAEVVASDLTAPMLAAAAAHFASKGAANIATELADAEALPFPDASFDVVTCRIAAHHFPQPQRFAAEAARVLRAAPGRPGRLIFSDLVGHEAASFDDFLHDVEWLRDHSHVRSYRVSQWVTWLAAAGFQVNALELIRRPHDIRDWMDRAKLPEAERPALLDAFRAASPSVRAAYEIAFAGELPVSFVTPVMVLGATKEV
ncbi:MAG TPA: methyltransferase domain-containing protein [Herpetosiphonaceae bacterium]